MFYSFCKRRVFKLYCLDVELKECLYNVFIMGLIMELGDILFKRLREAEARLRGRRKLEVDDIFKRVGYLYPWDFHVTNYPRKMPMVAFNPAALEVDRGRAVMFPRLIFDYYMYSSSIGVTEKILLDDLLEGKFKRPLSTRIILWPKYNWDLNGCEDARVHRLNDEVLLLYTAYGFHRVGEANFIRKPLLALAVLGKDWNVKRRGLFKIVKGGQEFIPESFKSSAIVKVEGDEMTLLTRPEIRGIRCCWRAKGSLENLTIDFDSLTPVLVRESFEGHVGWSTNVVRLSRNEYLVGWHGMVLTNLAYYNGLAIVDDQGELLALSNYLLAPRGLQEEYGDRSQVIYGTGLIKYKEFIVWIGGVSDYCTGIFIAELNKALEKVKWFKG